MVKFESYLANNNNNNKNDTAIIENKTSLYLCSYDYAVLIKKNVT